VLGRALLNIYFIISLARFVDANPQERRLFEQ
jgi:hypothetical protein